MELDDLVRVKVAKFGGAVGTIVKVLPDDMFLVRLPDSSVPISCPKASLELVRDLDIPTPEEREKVWAGYGVLSKSEEVRIKAVNLDVDLESLGAAVTKYIAKAEEVKKMKDEVTDALRECLSHYCPTCGFGDQGCSTIHNHSCPMLNLLARAEGRKLKLNQEPVDD